MYKQYITMKTLNRIITFCLIFMSAIVIILIMGYKLFKGNAPVNFFTVMFMELLFIFITIVAYIYLFYFVRSKLRVIKYKRHGSADSIKRLTLTVTYTYICLLFFTIPVVAKQVIRFSGIISDLRMMMH